MPGRLAAGESLFRQADMQGDFGEEEAPTDADSSADASSKVKCCQIVATRGLNLSKAQSYQAFPGLEKSFPLGKFRYSRVYSR